MNDTPDHSRIPYFPAFIDLRNRRCVVVGGGEIAEGKVATLTGSDAQVTVISPDVTPMLAMQAQLEGITLHKRCYQRGDLEGALLVIAATDHRATNEMVRDEAEERGILCCVVEGEELGNFIMPSSLQRGALTIAVSTAGVAPRLAQRIRTELERGYGQEYQELLQLLQELRPIIKEKIYDLELRRRLYDEMLDSPALAFIRRGVPDGAREILGFIVETAIGIQEGRIDQVPDHTIEPPSKE